MVYYSHAWWKLVKNVISSKNYSYLYNNKNKCSEVSWFEGKEYNDIHEFTSYSYKLLFCIRVNVAINITIN